MKVKQSAQISVHPYEAFIPKKATSLLIGTMPPYRFCVQNEPLYENDVRFFYGSRDNSFWNIVSVITEKPLSYDNSETSIQERKALLDSIGVGVVDILKSCYHTDGKSTDDQLMNEEFIDIKQLLSEHPDITNLIYSGQKVVSYMYRAVARYHSWEEKGKKGHIVINNKRFNVYCLKSPSPRAGWSQEELEDDYRTILLNKSL